MKKERILVLDSFRAIAILSVLLFHFFTRWTYPKSNISLYPYDDKYNYFEYGHLGVEFFFIISGFVIFFTLENTFSFSEFWVKRLIRLVPPAIVASTLTFITLKLIDTLYLFPSSHDVKNFIPSITFVSPQLINTITGSKTWSYIDGCYWSLWPEVQFYLLSSTMYFIKKDSFLKYFMPASTLLIVFNAGVKFFETRQNYSFLPDGFFLNYEKFIDKGFNLINYLPFFCLGISFYILYKNHSQGVKNHFYIKIYIAFLTMFILTVYGGLDVPIIVRVVYLLMLVVFLAFVYAPKSLSIFENKILTKIGVSSYFLYLIHQNIGVVIIYYFGQLFLPAGFILPLVLIIVLVIVSIFYSERVDRRISKWLKFKLFKRT